MKRFNIFIALMLAVFLMVGFIAFPQEKIQQKTAREAVSAVKEVYVCPMHPEQVSDKPGKCPKCGMDLVKKQAKEDESDEASSMCARMCDMMMKSSSRMNMMHEHMMEGRKESPSDSSHTGMEGMGMSCCRMMKKK